jgi:hypothetical protein
VPRCNVCYHPIVCRKMLIMLFQKVTYASHLGHSVTHVVWVVANQLPRCRCGSARDERTAPVVLPSYKLGHRHGGHARKQRCNHQGGGGSHGHRAGKSHLSSAPSGLLQSCNTETNGDNQFRHAVYLILASIGSHPISSTASNQACDVQGAAVRIICFDGGLGQSKYHFSYE